MKTKLIFAVLLTINLNGFAQDISKVESLSSSKLSVGLESGVSLIKIRTDESFGSSFQSKSAFVAGFNVNYELMKFLNIRASVNYENKRADYNIFSQPFIGSIYYYIGTIKYNFSYINIPISVSYVYSLKDKIKLYGGLGPNLSVLLLAKSKFKYNTDDETSSFKRIDFGLICEFGASYQLLSKIAVNASFRETLGLIDLLSDPAAYGIKFKTNSIAFLVGVKYQL